MLQVCKTPNARLLTRRIDGFKSNSLDSIIRSSLVELLKLEGLIIERTRFSLAHEFGHLYFFDLLDDNQLYKADTILLAREVLGPPHSDLHPEYELSELESGELVSSSWQDWPVGTLPQIPGPRWRLELKLDDPALKLRFQYQKEVSV
jgi:hypothetical protein